MTHVRHPVLRTAMLISLALLVQVASANQTKPGVDSMEQMLKQLEMLDQLDQLDREDFNAAIDKAYECAESRSFECADRQIEEAERLVFDSGSKEQVAKAREYRKEMFQIAEHEKQQLAMQRRIQQCSANCPIPNEYDDCVNGYLNANYCREPSYKAPSSSNSDNTLILLNQAVQQFKQITEDQLAQQRQQLQAQQRLYEEQQRRKAAFEREQEKRRREIERRRAQQLAQAERQQAELIERRNRALEEQRRLEARRRAEQEARLKAEERRQAQEARRLARQQEILARQQAREREKAEREARRVAYLEKLKNGIELRGGFCLDTQVVYGTVPDIKPKEVGCQDVYYDLYCPGSVSPQYKGVMETMVSNPKGACFMGDIDYLPEGIPCKASEFRVKVTKVTSC